MNTVVVSLGSNVFPRKNIKKARDILSQHFLIIRESRFVPTQAVGPITQADFINGVVLLNTALSRRSLKNELKRIENEMGRKSGGPKFGPRTIDLDIVVWNNMVVDNDFYQRDFLKAAVCEVLPDLKATV